MDIPRNPSNLPPIPERTSTPHVQHDTAPRGNNFHPDGRHGGPGTSTTGTLCASSTGTMNHTRAIEILDYTHDTRVCRPAGRVWSSEAARSGWACHRDPARRRTISHYVALRPDRNLSRDGSQWLTMARCAGRRTCDILRVGSLWFASGCFASSRVPGTPGGYVSGYCVAVPLSRRGTASRPVGIDRRGPAAVLKSIEVGVTL